MPSIVREGSGFSGVLNLLANCVFTFGALLVILFLFLPIIDRAYIDRQSALLDAGDNRERRLDNELRTKQLERRGGDKIDEGKKAPEREERENAERNWL